jgi:hypothetical protein
MEASVRYLHFFDSGCKPVVGFRGTKYASCIINDEEIIRVQKVDLREWDQMRRVPHRGGDYPLDRAIDHLKRLKRSKAITQAALELLERGDVLAEPPSDEPVPSPTTTAAPSAARPSNVLSKVCAELKIEPAAARRALRASGLRAPYDDEAKIRKALAK